MNKTEQAQQLRLAAELIETGHPFEVKLKGWWERMTYASPIVAIANGNEIRPILATPPDNRPLHNPDKLTAEQVGVGYRLALIDEKTNENETLQEFWNKGEWMTSGRVYSDMFGEAPNHRITYRLPLSVPWPEAKLDPYAELKAAHAAGKAIETQMPNGEWFDYKPGDPQWNLQPECYRIKPEPATKQVELGPEDVRCGDEILVGEDALIVTAVRRASIGVFTIGPVSYDALQSFKIRRRDSVEWEPCSKTVRIAH